MIGTLTLLAITLASGHGLYEVTTQAECTERVAVFQLINDEGFEIHEGGELVVDLQCTGELE